jgi:hypothetical protein
MALIRRGGRGRCGRTAWQSESVDRTVSKEADADC